MNFWKAARNFCRNAFVGSSVTLSSSSMRPCRYWMYASGETSCGEATAPR
jgi:hypothetical protein